MPRTTARDTTGADTEANRRTGQQTASDLAFLARAMLLPRGDSGEWP
ncbi:hypothetical protein [Streptomyces sp. NBC_01294]|nr:hypothetical protein [Streptomyces sp. NBC_01294]WRZ61092.1 hypothetical protein OG534_34105 [Streptomyces sp. NBC_01294]